MKLVTINHQQLQTTFRRSLVQRSKAATAVMTEKSREGGSS